MFSNEILFFLGFTAFIVGMLAIDLGVFSQKDHVVKFREAASWSAVWVLFALGFYVLLDLHGHLIHGIDDYDDLTRVTAKYMNGEITLDPNDFAASLELYRHHLSLEFITGYLLEYSLSVDNIFVIIMIFNSFGVREKYYKKVLFWGILGALVMRFTFIFVGSALIQEFHWIMYLFGAFLAITGVRMFFDKGEDEKIDPAKHPVVKLAAKWFKLYPRYVRSHFVVVKNGVRYLTPLFLVVLIIEFTDLIFAVDSVPAVFAVTEDPYIVFFSNIFAIMGLRSMFFFLSNIVGIFRYLKTGLAFLLIFIGFKMVAHDWLKAVGFETVYSLYVILGILGVSILASVIFKPKEDKSDLNETPLEHVEKELAKRLD
jgi:tellurite resistance protein TerC